MRIRGPKASEVDPAVDHLDTTARLGHRGLEPGTQPLRHGDGTRRATIVQRVAARTGRDPRAFSTSCPCAVTTVGALPASTASRPAGASARTSRRGGTGVQSWRRRGRASRAGTSIPPRWSTTARAIVCPRVSSACSRSATNVPSAGAPSPRYICETSRIRIERSLPGRHLDEPEAHLVARPLAPEDVAWRAATERRVVPARDAQHVPGSAWTRRSARRTPASGSSSAGSRAGAACAGCRGRARRGSSVPGDACGRRPPGS